MWFNFPTLYPLDYLLYYALSIVALFSDCYLRNQLQPADMLLIMDNRPWSRSGSPCIYGCTKMIFLAGNTMSKVPWFGTRYGYPMLTATLPCFTFGQILDLLVLLVRASSCLTGSCVSMSSQPRVYATPSDSRSRMLATEESRGTPLSSGTSGFCILDVT
jgi:hypothetical protein